MDEKWWKFDEKKDLARYLSDSTVVDTKGRKTLKEIADCMRNLDRKWATKGGRLSAPLVIENMDNEQIYQQILLMRGPRYNPGAFRGKLKFTHLGDDSGDEASSGSEGIGEADAEKSDEGEVDEVGDDIESDLEKHDIEDDEMLDGSEDGEEEVEEEEEDSDKQKSNGEDFFKLEEMEQFCNLQEKKEAGQEPENLAENSDESDEESVDMFQDQSDEETDARLARFKDFFVAKEDPEDKKRKRNKLMEELDEGSSDDEEPRAKKSTFEQRQERLAQKIERIEEGAISEKPWQLKGEISAKDRPQNSLMEEFVDFDACTRPAPVQTEQTTLKLEELIKQRIRDRNFDDPVRKAKPIETPLEYKKKLVLDQEKSKQSLAQIYENEYLKQKEALDPDSQDKEEEEPELHKEITRLLNGLFYELDSLSNFHMTPAPVRAEARVVKNASAISMEEVAPVAVSDGALLAPEEIKRRPKGDVVGSDERTSTDKKRARRRKKKKQQIHARRQQKLEESGKSKASVESVTKRKNVDKMDQSTEKKVTSSTAFFTQLEDVVKVGSKFGVKKKNEKKQIAPAKKYKL